jgi:hypothetical protein
MTQSTPQAPVWPQRWQRFSAAAVRAFHVYGTWLASISWKRFVLLAVLLLIVVNCCRSCRLHLDHHRVVTPMVGQVKLPWCRPCRPWWCRMSTSRFPAGAPVAMAARVAASS